MEKRDLLLHNFQSSFREGWFLVIVRECLLEEDRLTDVRPDYHEFLVKVLVIDWLWG